MQRLAPHDYRHLYPRTFALWAGHLGFSPPARRHWLSFDRVIGRDGSIVFSPEASLISVQLWWEVGLSRNLVFSTRVEVKRGRLTPEGEALWVGHRLIQLFELCAEPGLVQCHSPEIQGFWTKIVSELFEKPRAVDTIG